MQCLSFVFRVMVTYGMFASRNSQKNNYRHYKQSLLLDIRSQVRHCCCFVKPLHNYCMIFGLKYSMVDNVELKYVQDCIIADSLYTEVTLWTNRKENSVHQVRYHSLLIKNENNVPTSSVLCMHNIIMAACRLQLRYFTDTLTLSSSIIQLQFKFGREVK